MKFLKIFFLAAASWGLIHCGGAQTKTVPDDERNPQYQYEKAVVAMKYGLPDQALDYLRQSLILDPRYVPSYNLLGKIHIQARNFAEAVKALEKCLEIKPDFPETLNNLGTAYQGLGEKDKAEEAFRKAFDLDGNAYAAFGLAKILLEKQKPEEALGYVEESIRKAGTQAPAHNLKGVILNQMDRYEEAVTSFEAALALDSGDVNTRVNLGIALLNSRQYEKSTQVFEKVLPLIQDPVMRNRVGEYLRWLKEADR